MICILLCKRKFMKQSSICEINMSCMDFLVSFFSPNETRKLPDTSQRRDSEES